MTTMRRWRWTWVLWGPAVIWACGSEVTVLDGGGGDGANPSTSSGTSTTGTGTGTWTGTGTGSGTTGTGVGTGSGTGAGTTGTGSGTGAGTTGTGSGTGAGTGTGTGGTGTGTWTGTGTGGTGTGTWTDPSDQCLECVQLAIEAPCAFLFEACVDDMACGLLLDCYQQCGASAACVYQCNDIVPSGVWLMGEVLGCAACVSCGSFCDGSALQFSCF